MWERFSYYGMRALLILYMAAAVAEGGLGFDTAKFAIGLDLLGAGFLVLVWATMLAAGGEQVSPMWLVLPLPQLFGAVVLATAGSGVVLALFIRPIRKLMAGVQ